MQDVFLFSGTIFSNITLGDPQFTQADVESAAKAVGAHDFIMKLPGNYQHEIGERGGMLSVGQRQLIAFIRAYIYAPQILILDEATSNVDSESEQLIQRATENHLRKDINRHSTSTINDSKSGQNCGDGKR